MEEIKPYVAELVRHIQDYNADTADELAPGCMAVMSTHGRLHVDTALGTHNRDTQRIWDIITHRVKTMQQQGLDLPVVVITTVSPVSAGLLKTLPECCICVFVQHKSTATFSYQRILGTDRILTVNLITGEALDCPTLPSPFVWVGKVDHTLIPPKALEGIAMVRAYSRDRKTPKRTNASYRTAEPQNLLAAAYRHLEKYRQGVEFDSDSKLPNIDHAMTNLTLLRELGHTPGAWDE